MTSDTTDSVGSSRSLPNRRVSLPEEDQMMRQRVPFVSRHRVTMDRIKNDASESRPYEVPNGKDAPEQPLSRKITGKLHKSFQDTDRQQLCEVLLPCWRWMRSYDFRNTFMSDVIAGLTVGVMIIPQSMSYAKLAGLPVEFGLYSALVPIYAYSIFGSSRQLAVGPVALVSLLLNSGLTQVMQAEGISEDDAGYQERYNTLAIQTSCLVGATYILMGILRMGFVTIFLSHAVISGFTSGAAVIIGLSQVKYIVGYDIAGSKNLHKLVKALLDNIDQFNYKTFVFGMTAVFTLVSLKTIGKRYPKFSWVRAAGPLAVTAISIILVVALDLNEKGIPIVGAIPKGLPSLTVNQWSPIEGGGNLLIVVVSIVIVGFMESIAIAKQLASKHKYEIDSSQELIGLGMSNFLGGMFGSYPVTGSFSRSAVNNESGAKSGVSGMVTATLVAFVLLLLTVVFEKLPLCILAAVVIAGVIGLIDYPEAIYLYKVHKFDFMVWLTACLGTMFLGVEVGLAIAVGVSLLIVIYESAYPHTSVLGRLPGTAHYRNVKQYQDAEVYDGIVIMRIDAPLYFANAQNMRDKIRKYRLQAEDRAARDGTHPVQYLVLELGPVSHVDTSALHILEDMHVNYSNRNQQLVFCNPSLNVMGNLVSSGLADKVGREFIFPSVHDAVQQCLSTMDVEARSMHESVHEDTSNHDDEPVLSSETELSTP